MAGDTGIHHWRQSLARQWGWRVEEIDIRCCGYGAGPLIVRFVTDWMGSCRGLVSGTLLSLVTQCPPSKSSNSHTHTRHPIAIFLATSLGLDIDKEGSDLVWDDNGIE